MNRLLDRLSHGWSRFWFAEGSALPLGLFRILFAVAAARDVSSARDISLFAIRGGFHDPYLDWLPLPSASTYDLLHALQYPLLLFFGLGLWTRAAAGALALIQGYVFFSDQLTFRNHGYLFLLLFVIFAAIPAPRGLSLATFLRDPAGGRIAPLLDARGPLTCQRLIAVQIAVVYFYAGLQKFHRAFLDGRLLAENLQLFAPSAPLHSILSGAAWQHYLSWIQNPAWFAGPSIAVAVWEIVIPFAVWTRRWRPWLLAFGVLFHVVCWVTLGVFSFTTTMLSSYLLFLDPEAVAGLGRLTATPAAPRSGRPTFDGGPAPGIANAPARSSARLAP